MSITIAHGSGGAATAKLIEEVFLPCFGVGPGPLTDAAVLQISGRLAFTTDSFVVKPLFFPGGDIGRLAVCGTVNDLLTAGARPLYLSAGFILKEGLPIEDLRRVCRSMADAAREAGVRIVTGDTKVVEGRGGLFINTAGVGSIRGPAVTFSDAVVGDAILVSGNLGDHHACILGCRLGLENKIRSDVAPLTEMIAALLAAEIPLHGMRDITRGGLATVLSEVAAAAGLAPFIREEELPVHQAVSGFAKVLGLDPLYMGNEGKMLMIVPDAYRHQALDIIRRAQYGAAAAAIGVLAEGMRPVLLTRLGGRRHLSPLRGEGLPRIC